MNHGQTLSLRLITLALLDNTFAINEMLYQYLLQDVYCFQNSLLFGLSVYQGRNLDAFEMFTLNFQFH
jgi:hypothetical protein